MLKGPCVCKIIFRYIYRETYFYLVVVALANPCLVNNGGCSDICSKTLHGRICSCNPGFSLDFDGVTCKGTFMHPFHL